MADIQEKIIFDDSQVIKSLTNQFALVTKVNLAIREQEMTYKEAYDVATKQIESTNEVIEDGTKAIGKHTSETIKAKNESKGWGNAMKGLADEVNIMGVNLGRTIDQLRSKAQAMKAMAVGVNAGTNALKIFKIALISTGIGALVVALGSLVAFFAKTERGAEKIERAMAGVGAVVNVLIDRFAMLGEAITKFFQGDFKGSFEQAKASVAGLNDEISREVGLLVDLKRREQELDDQRRLNNKTVAENIVKLKEAQLLADDANAKGKDRLDAIQKAGKIEKDNLEANLKIAEEAYNIELLRYEAGAKKDAEADALNEKFIAMEELKAESLTRQKKIQGQTQSLQAELSAKENERLEKIREINKALEDQVKKITDAADKANFETLDPEQRILAEANVAKATIEEQFKMLDAFAKRAGKEVDLSREKEALLISIEKHTAREIEKVRNESIAQLGETILKPIEAIERGAVDIVGNVTGALAKMANNPEVEKAFESLNYKLGKAFNLDEEEFAAAMSSIGNSLNSLFDSMTAGTERQLEENEALIESIQERRDVLNEDLEKELERQEAGLANNISGKRKELESLRIEEEKAEKEREKLRKKQLAQKLIADSLTQTSNLITMGSNVIAAESGKGLLGVGLALAAIAAFVSIFSSFKSGSKKLSGGGSLQQDGVTGFVNRQGRTDRNGGRGHAVEDSNLILGGKEFVVNENTSMRHAEFLEALNRGEFDNSDGLHFAMGHTRELEHNSAIVGAMNERRASAGMAEAVARAVGQHMSGLASVIKSRENVYSYTPGDIVVKEKDGKTMIRQTEPDWRWKPERRG